MNREDLKKYRYNQEWINDQMEYIEGQKAQVNKLTATLSDMPMRRQGCTRQHGGKISKNNGQS